MAQIQVSNLTFSYDGSGDDVFTDTSFNIDTDWKLGLIGRNGKGKSTLLNLLQGKYEYQGRISTNVGFDYFPYPISEEDLATNATDLIERWKPQVEIWQVLIQMNLMSMDPECLYRPFGTLSFGERTRVMLAVLFSGENEFLLIDEPTNHLDDAARGIIKAFLAAKKGFILVSHDRDMLDGVCDHVLVLNRATVEVQSGNFSSWWENKEKKDAFNLSENEKHLKEIGKLKKAADRSGRWADKNEKTKIGFDPVKDHDRSISTRSFIGAKTKKMQARVKAYESRIDREIEEQEGLLQDIERVKDLKMHPVDHHKDVLVDARELTLRYPENDHPLFEALAFQIKQGERVVLSGSNGCGKTSLIGAILSRSGFSGSGADTEILISGELDVASGMIISYVNQDTSFLTGTAREFCAERGLDESLFFTALRHLGFEREQFVKDMEDYSEGQKKKVLIAASLITPAHLYVWDEPLNYIDVFSRMQIEKLIQVYEPTMLIVEHDVRFQEMIASKTVYLRR